MKAHLTALLIAGLATSACAGDVASPPGPVPSARQLKWHELEVYGLLHYSLNTYTGKEWGLGNEDPKTFNPAKFDAHQIARAAKAGGLKGLIIVAKHHCGFCLWPSDYTEYSIKNSPWKDGKGDMMGELTKACRDEGLAVGMYLSPWDRNHKDYAKPEYVTYFRNQLRELLTNYGPMFEVWFDGANGGSGYYGGANETRKIGKDYYGWETTIALVRELQPDACMFLGGDIRWVANEKGVAPTPCWSTFNSQTHGAGASTGHRDGKYWVPAEADFPQRQHWFFDGAGSKKPAELVDKYFVSVGHNAAMNIGLAPNRDGLLCDGNVQALKGFGDRIRAIFATNLAAAAKVSKTDTEHVLEFGKPTEFSVISLREDLKLGERVDDWVLELWQQDAWKEFARGTGIGNRRLWRGELPMTTDKIRLQITKSSAPPALREFAVYLEKRP